VRTLVTVGTEDGVWAPPRSIWLVATLNTPSGLGLTNAEPVRWRLTGKAKITQAALAVGGGGWVRLTIKPITAGKGREALIAAESIAIDVGLTAMSTSEIRAQGLLEGRLKEIGESH
jgi:hypothetical protein